MANTVAMRAPTGGVTTIYSSITLQTYTANANGYALVDPQDVPNLLAAGWTIGAAAANAYTANTATVDTTATAASLAALFAVLNMTGNIAADKALTLPTVAALIAAVPGVKVGDSLRLRVINSDADHVWTVTTADGWTLSGTMTLAAATYRDFIITFTNVSTGTEAATLQQIGTGATS